MFLMVIIVVLFAYTLILLVFFVGYCTLVPSMCHPRKEIPFASIKSPRRNTALTDLESLSSNYNYSINSLDLPSLTLKLVNETAKAKIYEKAHWEGLPTKYNAERRQSDYLHPKYSLPPIKISLDEKDLLAEYENYLRIPISTSVSGSGSSNKLLKSATTSPSKETNKSLSIPQCTTTLPSPTANYLTKLWPDQSSSPSLPTQDPHLLTVPDRKCPFLLQV